MSNNKKPSGRSRALTPSTPRTALSLLAAALLAACQSYGPDRAQNQPAAVVPPPVTAADLQAIRVPAYEYRDPIVEESDLLERLRSQFELPPGDKAAVQHEAEWFAGHQQYLDRVFDRSGPYLFHIVEALEERGMPVDLALLPVVESAFDPFAYSHGRAAGLWQIIPGTGKRLGLQQDWWFDGRRDVLESTRAALDYLQQLHDQFDGDWLLAIAGYNSGEGNVARAVQRAAAAGKPTDFWGVRNYLPVETRTYVPRLLAIRNVVLDPAKYGLSLPELANEPQFAVVETGSQIDMALAAELAGVHTDELYALNAGFNRWATDPDGPHRLLVPAAQAEQFESGLAALGDRPRVEWTRYRVKEGESIATLADRYRTTPAVLRQVNNLRSNNLRAGEFLMIPRALQSFSSYTQSADMRAARQQNAPHDGQRKEHVVQAGETLWSISRDYGVDLRALASWNAMAPGDVLSVGRDLVVWTEGAPSAAASATRAAVALPATALRGTGRDMIRQVNYVVRRGDSLYSIAKRFRVTVPNLLEWNSVKIAQVLKPGQHLVMFVNVAEQSS
jgi:membrane-bound lytic murein transglycosylase D